LQKRRYSAKETYDFRQSSGDAALQGKNIKVFVFINRQGKNMKVSVFINRQKHKYLCYTLMCLLIGKQMQVIVFGC